jgi:hypothetical protein
MTQYVGLDVSLKETKLHVLDEAGNRVWRGRCATSPPHAGRDGALGDASNAWMSAVPLKAVDSARAAQHPRPVPAPIAASKPQNFTPFPVDKDRQLGAAPCRF